MPKLFETYTIFMYIYDEYKRFGKNFANINDFLMASRIQNVVDFYKTNYIGKNFFKKIHYKYYKEFSINIIDIIQAFLPESVYIPPYRLLLCKPRYDKYGIQRYGWKNVIHFFLEGNYTEDCFHDDFYYENPGFEWVSYANMNGLSTYQESIEHYKKNGNRGDMKILPFLIFDDWFEMSFPNRKYQLPMKKYKYPFFSFLHNPPCIGIETQTIIYKNKDVFRNTELKSVEQNLKLLVSLSSHHMSYLNELQLDWKIKPKNVSIYHPIEDNISNTFDLHSFIQSSTKYIFYIGWWLRKYDTFMSLKNHHKIVVIKSEDGTHVENYIHNEIIKTSNSSLFTKEEMSILSQEYNTTIAYNLKNEVFDSIFKQNIVFLELYDTVANNIILECIMHNTPILINYLPSTVEYLGQDYPFYFTNLADAQVKLDSITLIIDTHHYLKNMDKTRFTYHHFNTKLKESIYDVICDLYQ